MLLAEEPKYPTTLPEDLTLIVAEKVKRSMYGSMNVHTLETSFNTLSLKTRFTLILFQSTLLSESCVL